jgi:hypothetical protein
MASHRNFRYLKPKTGKLPGTFTVAPDRDLFGRNLNLYCGSNARSIEKELTNELACLGRWIDANFPATVR